MRTSTFTKFVVVASLSLATAACSGPDRLSGPDGAFPSNPNGTTGGTGSTPGGTTGGSPTGPTDPTTGGGTPATDFPGGNPGDSPTGGQTETQQSFTGWRLEVLPSGELRLRFRQTNLPAASLTYTLAAQVEGDVQCYNKADNAPQGQPFAFAITASPSLAAQSSNGTIDATLTTAVLEGACGNTQFTARPDTTARPFRWTTIALTNPNGQLPLPDIALGDAPKGFRSN